MLRGRVAVFLVLGLFSVSCVDRARPENELSEFPSRQTLQTWGVETLAMIDRDYRLPNSVLYREHLGDSRPGSVWPASVQLSALNAAAKVDASNWLNPALVYAHALDRYWVMYHDLAGYDPVANPKTINRYYDDNAWLALDLCDCYELSRDTSYLKRAEQTVGFILSGEDDKLGGGIYWRENDKSSKNTCSNAPTIVACLRLYQLTQTPEYLTVATRLYAWVNIHLQDADGLYFDHMALNGQIEKTKWTYNTALMLRANCLFYQLTQVPKYLDEAERIAGASLEHWFRKGDGALMDEGNFAHHMVEALLAFEGLQSKIKDRKSKIADIRPRILRALDYLHAHAPDSAGHYPKRWDTPTTQPIEKADLLAQASAARAYLFVAGN